MQAAGDAGRFDFMRILLTLLFALCTLPAFAQGWGHYENARFGYGIDIPPGFSGNGESDNGDGQGFTGPGQSLLVWGGHMMSEDFEAEVASAIGFAEGDAWNITGQTVTPHWASFSAIKGFRILHQRMILLCDGTSYAAFQADYVVTESADMRPVIERLEASFRASGC